MLADWADTLQDWHVGQIKTALREWRDENPDKRPNPAHIRKIMLERRGKRIAAQLPKQENDPEPQRISAERAAQIVEEFGFGGVKKFGGDDE